MSDANPFGLPNGLNFQDRRHWLRVPEVFTIRHFNKERVVKELLIVVGLIVIGTECIAMYNEWEEPHASRKLRFASLSTDLMKTDQPVLAVSLRGAQNEWNFEPTACPPR